MSMSSLLKKTVLLTLLYSNCAVKSKSIDVQTPPPAIENRHINNRPLNVAFLVSGSGSNMEAILRYFEQPGKEGIINPCVVISNKKDARALKRARLEVETTFKKAVPTAHLPCIIRKSMTDEKKQEVRKEYAQKLITCLKDHGVTRENGLICGAGFMVIIHKDFLDHFANQVISIHPTLLDAFPGADGIERAFKRGVKVSGPSVHFVDEGMDTGPIIGQNQFAVADDDTLETFEQKTHEAEWELYSRVVEQIAQGEIKIVNKSADGGPERAVIGFKLHD